MTMNAHYPSAAPVSFNENTLDITVEHGTIKHCPEVALGYKIMRSNKGIKQRRNHRNGIRSDTIYVNRNVDSRDYWRLEATPPLVYYCTHLRRSLVNLGMMAESVPAKPRNKVINLMALLSGGPEKLENVN